MGCYYSRIRNRIDKVKNLEILALTLRNFNARFIFLIKELLMIDIRKPVSVKCSINNKKNTID